MLTSLFALFLTISYHVGVTDNESKQRGFIFGSFFASYSFLRGIRIFPLW
jgi:prolipoprotein diacylglyceryltransferase